MKILSIETSCDETALCYLETSETDTGIEFRVHRNITHTQMEHVAYGGVVPMVAKREHQANLPIILDAIMADMPVPDRICVTTGPGLEPALWCGIVFANELGAKWNIPVVPVNHMEGHILSVLVPSEFKGSGSEATFVYRDDIAFPALALLISGGHTELVLARAIGDYEIIGRTRDDAVGEAFDKVARLIGLPYPGGPEVAKLADQYISGPRPEFPRPMIHTPDYDFSFSGLKTAVLYYTQTLPQPIPDETKIAIAYEFQQAVTDVLVKKTWKACKDLFVQSLIVGGGVAANTHIRSAIETQVSGFIEPQNIRIAARELTGDNALMIAIAGYFKIRKNPDAVYGDIKADGNWSL